MVDYIDEFLNGSSKAAKTYTIEEYLKEFTKAGDMVVVANKEDDSALGVIDTLKSVILTLPLEIRHTELKTWMIKVPSDPKLRTIHILNPTL